MLSRDCDGCSQMKQCIQRYHRVGKGDKVYCPDGTTHLVDENIPCQITGPDEQMLAAIQ